MMGAIAPSAVSGSSGAGLETPPAAGSPASGWGTKPQLVPPASRENLTEGVIKTVNNGGETKWQKG